MSTYESLIPELELNKETLQDLGVDSVDAAQIRGGAGIIAVAPNPTIAIQNPSGGIIQNPSGGIVLNPSGGRA
jgi:hypothetical protein